MYGCFANHAVHQYTMDKCTGMAPCISNYLCMRCLFFKIIQFQEYIYTHTTKHFLTCKYTSHNVCTHSHPHIPHHPLTHAPTLVHTHTHPPTHTPTHTSTHPHIHPPTHTSTHPHTHPHIHPPTHPHIHPPTCMYARTHTCTHAPTHTLCACVCVYVCAGARVHPHPHPPSAWLHAQPPCHSGPPSVLSFPSAAPHTCRGGSGTEWRHRQYTVWSFIGKIHTYIYIYIYTPYIGFYMRR